jgi:endonuclease/exonuclease/phosphatase family metal-dependent hydrolase
MIDWVLNSDADIQCYQEFPHRLLGGKREPLAAFKDKYNCYFSADTNKLDRSLFGILIVSRFPIIDSGDVFVSRNGYNRIAFADVDVGSDTLRVVNVHLQSMQMKGYHPRYSEDFEGTTHSARIVLQKLKYGVFERRRQISELINSYKLMKKRLKNAFEESGKGFGFTYNGNTLNMLRIDNQFYSPTLESLSFETLNTVRYTDHFPLVGTYLNATQ